MLTLFTLLATTSLTTTETTTGTTTYTIADCPMTSELLDVGAQYIGTAAQEETCSQFTKTAQVQSIEIVPRSQAAAAGSDDLIVIAGGRSSKVPGCPIGSVEAFNITSATLFSLPGLDIERADLAAASAGRFLVFAGGVSSAVDGTCPSLDGPTSVFSDVIDVYFSDQKLTSISGKLSTPRRALAAAGISELNMILIAGGRGAAVNYTDWFDGLPPETFEWGYRSLGPESAAAQMRTACGAFNGSISTENSTACIRLRKNMGSAVFLRIIAENLAIRAAEMRNVFSAAVDRITLKSGFNVHVEEFGSLSSPRSNLAGAATNGIFAFGGGVTWSYNDAIIAAADYRLYNGVATNAVDIYHTLNDSWTTTRLSEKRSHLAAASTSIGVIAFAGGLTAAGVASDVVDIFNVDTYEWTAGNLVSPRLGLAGAAAGAWLVFAGGYSTNGDGGDNAEVTVYHTITRNWTYDSYSLKGGTVRGMLTAAGTGSTIAFGGGSSGGYRFATGLLDIFVVSDDADGLVVVEETASKKNFNTERVDVKGLDEITQIIIAAASSGLILITSAIYVARAKNTSEESEEFDDEDDDVVTLAPRRSRKASNHPVKSKHEDFGFNGVGIFDGALENTSNHRDEAGSREKLHEKTDGQHLNMEPESAYLEMQPGDITGGYLETAPFQHNADDAADFVAAAAALIMEKEIRDDYPEVSPQMNEASTGYLEMQHANINASNHDNTSKDILGTDLTEAV